jgi:PPOX class probable F420-dependent enzyme
MVPDSHLDLLTSNHFGHLATVNDKGQPQVTPVWFRYDHGKLEVNSAAGRLKDRNMRSNPQVALSVLDPKNSYRYLEVRGKVVEITMDGAEDGIDQLAHRYMGVEKYPFRQPGEQRVRYVIEVTKCTSMG